ncbi:MAG TPA: FtsX-like permease family protein, partial [Longimicrobiales bacterium]|nr:FtsX-like permease family protein [Longimicrobiales bacterium]
VYLPTVLLPEGGFGLPVSNFVAVLRTSGDPRAVIPAVRRTIRDFDPEIPVDRVERLERLTARSFQRVTFAMVLLLVAGGISLVLGVVGVYGTVAWVVGQRTREFGLRMALGAGRRDVWRQVLLRAGLVGGAGVILGSGVALVMARVLDSLLFEVGRADPAVYAVAGTGVLALVLVASLTPAARAASVDPATAMRAN